MSQYYYPDNFRINEIAAELVRQGHTVNVLTGLPDYTTSHIPAEYRFFRKRHEVVEGVSITRVPIIARRHGAFFRALNYLSFAACAGLYVLFTSNAAVLKADIIYVYQTSPVTMALPAILLKHRIKKKLHLYCLDLWPESVKVFGIDEKSIVFKVIDHISRLTYRHCDSISVTSEPFEHYIRAHNRFAGPITYLPQHGEETYLSINTTPPADGCINFVFAGNIGHLQNVSCIIEAVNQIKDLSGFLVHIVGNGSEESLIAKLVDEYELQDKVLLYGRRPLEDMPEFYRLADVFLLTLRGDTVEGHVLPAKLQGYMAAGKPVVASADGATEGIICKAQCGWCVTAGDVSALAVAMRRAVEHPNQLHEYGEGGRRFFLENFTKAKFITQLIKQLEGGKESG